MREDDEKRGRRSFHMPPSLQHLPTTHYTNWDNYFEHRGFPHLIKETALAKDDVLLQSLSAAYTCPLSIYHTLTSSSVALPSLTSTVSMTRENKHHKRLTIHVLGAASQEELLVKIYWHELCDILPGYAFDIVLIGPEISESAMNSERVVEISQDMTVMYAKMDYLSFIKNPPSFINTKAKPDMCIAFNR